MRGTHRRSASTSEYPAVLVLDPDGHNPASPPGLWSSLAEIVPVAWFCLRQAWQADDCLVDVRAQLECSLGNDRTCVLVAGHGAAHTAMQAAAPRAGLVHTVLTEADDPAAQPGLAHVLRNHGTAVTPIPAGAGNEHRDLTRATIVDAVIASLISSASPRTFDDAEPLNALHDRTRRLTTATSSHGTVTMESGTHPT